MRLGGGTPRNTLVISQRDSFTLKVVNKKIPPLGLGHRQRAKFGCAFSTGMRKKKERERTHSTSRFVGSGLMIISAKLEKRKHATSTHIWSSSIVHFAWNVHENYELFFNIGLRLILFNNSQLIVCDQRPQCQIKNPLRPDCTPPPPHQRALFRYSEIVIMFLFLMHFMLTSVQLTHTHTHACVTLSCLVFM